MRIARSKQGESNRTTGEGKSNEHCQIKTRRKQQDNWRGKIKCASPDQNKEKATGQLERENQMSIARTKQGKSNRTTGEGKSNEHRQIKTRTGQQEWENQMSITRTKQGESNRTTEEEKSNEHRQNKTRRKQHENRGGEKIK